MKEEIQALIVYRLQQARDSLSAGQLAFDADLYRDCVNRCYYAMFYAVLALLGQKGETPCKHTQAIGLFDLKFVKERLIDKEFSVWLHEAFDLRQRADYREMVVISKERAGDIIMMARKFIEFAQAYLEQF